SASLTDLARPGEFPSSRPDFLRQVHGALRRACTCRYVGPTAVARLVLVSGEGGAWRSADLLPQHALVSSRRRLGTCHRPGRDRLDPECRSSKGSRTATSFQSIAGALASAAQ